MQICVILQKLFLTLGFLFKDPSAVRSVLHIIGVDGAKTRIYFELTIVVGKISAVSIVLLVELGGKFPLLIEDRGPRPGAPNLQRN